MNRERVLICGLGNPGSEYRFTRHNVGFMNLDLLAEKWGLSFKSVSKVKGEVAAGTVGDVDVYLLKPMTYMNLSGGSVRKALDYYKVDIADFIVVCDDCQLSFGEYRLREKGSSGGHNGLKDIEEKLGTREYTRLRVGIGEKDCFDLSDYVLSNFKEEELSVLSNVLNRGVHVLDLWMKEEIEQAQKACVLDHTS